MYISKNKTLKELKQEKGNNIESFLFGHTWAILKTENDNSVTIYHVPSGCAPRAIFMSTKEAVQAFQPLDKASMSKQGYQAIELHNSLSLIVYYHNEEDGTKQMIDQLEELYILNDDAYKIGDTGISVCLARHIDKADIKDKESCLLQQVDDFCAHSLSPEEHDKWEEIRSILMKRRGLIIKTK